jgi:hypothetical protein
VTEMTEKEGQGAKIRKGLSSRRDPTCYQVLSDVVIPAGTILRHLGGDKYGAAVGLGNTTGEFSLIVKPGAVLPAGTLKKVIA